jgi:arylsulfatase A-like enzyme
MSVRIPLLSGLLLMANVLFVLADDHGFNALSCTGAKEIKTPGIDRLRDEGMLFNSFYVHNRCSPTRLAFMTGCRAQRAGYAKVIYRHSLVGINEKEITTPELLKTAGYATGMVGKWHLGEFDQFNPTRHGFDFFYGFMSYDDKRTAIYRNKEIVEKDVQKCDGVHSEKLLKAGIDFIKANKDKPFFLYYASPLPHTPWIPSARFKGSSGHGAYGDVMQELDWQVGELLATLDKLGLTKNTLVIYTSDNGPVLGIGGEETSGPFRDGKWTNFEGGIRVPCLMRWPGVVAPGSSNDKITGIVDLLPTLCDIAGVNVPTDRVIDGRSIRPYMQGRSLDKPIHHSFMVHGATYRYCNWKLIYRKQTPGGQERRWGKRVPAEAGSLFDLREDPGETKNVAAQHPEIVADLTRRMEAAIKELDANTREIGKTPDYSPERIAEHRNKAKKGKKKGEK